MSTPRPCPLPPYVANAQPATVYQDARTADYACASGFKISGSSRIYCDNTTLQWYYGALPTCTVIVHTSSYPIWTYAVFAGLLGLLALVSFIFLLAYCCGWCANSVSPSGGAPSSRGCCPRSHRRRSLDDNIGVRRPEVQRTGVYYVSYDLHTKDNLPRHVQNTRSVRPVVVSKTGQQKMVLNDGYATRAYVVTGNDDVVTEKAWFPHTHSVRNNTDSTK